MLPLLFLALISAKEAPAGNTNEPESASTSSHDWKSLSYAVLISPWLRKDLFVNTATAQLEVKSNDNSDLYKFQADEPDGRGMGFLLMNKAGEYFIIDPNMTVKLVQEKPQDLWLFAMKRSGSIDVSYARFGTKCLLYTKDNQLTGTNCADIGENVEEDGFIVIIMNSSLKEVSDEMRIIDSQIATEKSEKNVEEPEEENKREEQKKEEFVGIRFEDGMPEKKNEGGTGKRGRDAEEEGKGPESKRAKKEKEGDEPKKGSQGKGGEGKSRKRPASDDDEEEDEGKGKEKGPKRGAKKPRKGASDEEKASPSGDEAALKKMLEDLLAKVDNVKDAMEKREGSGKSDKQQSGKLKQPQRGKIRAKGSGLKPGNKDDEEDKLTGGGLFGNALNTLGNVADLAVNPTKKAKMALNAAEALKGLLEPETKETE